MSGELFQMACRSCGGRHVEIFLDLGEQPHCNRLIPPERAALQEPVYPLRAGFCHDCTLVQIDHTIAKENMFCDYPYVSGTTRTLREHFRQTAQRLIAACGLTDHDLVVDIGSNDGTALEPYQARGVRVLGVEPASNVARIAEIAGVPTLNRFFNAAAAEHILATEGPAKLITAAGVFFHLEELHSVCVGIERLLADDGVFAVQAIYLGGMIENTAFDQIYHEHLCYYTLKSLNNLLRSHGMEVFEATLVPIHGGTLEARIGRIGRRPIGASVRALAQTEETRGYHLFDTYRRFAARVWNLKQTLIQTLAGLKAEGLTIDCYGAPAKGATLLNAFGINGQYIRRAAEKSPLKFNRMIPGVRVPIEDEAEGERPDAYLVLAWNFLDEFLVKEAVFLEGGGRFIVPIPTVRIIGKEAAAVG